MFINFKVKIELPIIRLGSLLERVEQVLDAVRGERRLAKDMYAFERRPSNLGIMSMVAMVSIQPLFRWCRN